MKRRKIILKHIRKDQRGIEIGPWFSPLAAKNDGFNSLVLDVFDKDRLIKNAIADPAIPDDRVPCIEDVDLLGTSTEIEQLVASRNELGAFDYVVSSHNFEHLPNPIKFLQGCGRVLKQDGIISMAIPDKRVCFDVFKTQTTLGQWIEAFLEKRERPSLRQIFEHESLFANFNGREPHKSQVNKNLKALYAQWIGNIENKNSAYQDAHCWIFTPLSFELLIREVYFLGLSPFEIVEISKTKWGEFYVHLRNAGYAPEDDVAFSREFHVQRQNLLTKITQDKQYFQSVRRRIVAGARSIIQKQK